MSVIRCIGGLAVAFVWIAGWRDSACASIPEAALLKTNSAGSPGNYVFKPSVLFDPTAYNGDASTGLQVAIDAIAKASLSKGGVLFIRPGTYTLTRTVKIAGSGIALVGVRDATGPGTWGPYPTFRYGNAFYDPDYQPGSTNAALATPAVLRVNGNTDYSTQGAFSFNGLHGLNIECAASGNTTGAIATAVSLHMVHLSAFRDISISNAWNGVAIVDSTTPSFHNLNILGLRGDFGIRCGDPASDALKVQGLTVTAAAGNTTSVLALIAGNTEFVGADLTGGKTGIEITGVNSLSRAGDVFIRSVRIRDPAQRGVSIGYASQVYITDLQIERAGWEGLDISSNFYGGLTIANLKILGSGYSGLRVRRGMNISMVNAELLASGTRKAQASGSDLPIAGLRIDSSVTSFNLVGARIGTAEVQHEDWGVYLATNAPVHPPWHPPVIIVQNLESPLPPAKQAFGIAIGPGSFEQLRAAGYFSPPAGDAWTNAHQRLPTNPSLTGWLTQAKGYNLYDLPELRNRMWIDLSSPALSPPVITNSLYFDHAAFASLLNEVSADPRFSAGAVLYLPSGRFSNTSFTNYTRKIYRLNYPLNINRPNIHLLGDGRDVTQIYTSTFAETNDYAVKLTAGAEGSGVYGLSVYHEKADLMRTDWPLNTAFRAPFRIENTGNIRLAGTSTRYSMGGAYSLLNVTNAMLYDCLPLACGFNNTQPTDPLAAFDILGTASPGSSSDIHLYQCVGNDFPNIWMNSSNRFCGWNPDGTSCDTDVTSSACYLPTDMIPTLDWVRLAGGVQRVKIDYCTFLEGKNGIVATETDGWAPRDISTYKFATDHNYDAGMWLRQITNADFVGNWAAGRRIGARIEPKVSGTIRYFNQPVRGCGLEGLLINGGDHVSLINCQVGNNAQLWTGVAPEARPYAGIHFGNTNGSNIVVGGLSGWLFNADYNRAHVNPGEQDWGIVLATHALTNTTSLYGVDLDGNGDSTARNPASPPGYRRGLGVRTNIGLGVAWLSDVPTWNGRTTNGLPFSWLEYFRLATDGSSDAVDNDRDLMKNWQEFRASTVPTNSQSKLAIRGIYQTNHPNGARVITWQSSTNVVYTVEVASDLLRGFNAVVAAGVKATPPINALTDTNASPQEKFYRVRVE